MKKTWNFVFIGSILLLASEHKLLAEERENQNSLYSSTNHPTIYGTKYIQIHSEDELSLLNPKYRVWADDFEDGDITNQIKVVSIDGKEPEQMITKEGKVNPLEEGKHQIHYQVMDKDHNISEFTTEIDVLSTPHDKTLLEDEIVKSVLKKPKAEYTDKVGMKRGDEGDRQIVGIQLEPGQSIEAKVLGDEELQFNLLTEDRNKDVYEKVNGTGYKKFSPKESKFELVYGRTSSSDTTAVPFIDTPRYDTKDGIQNQTVDVHYKIGHDIRTVPYWHEGDNEETFFDQWKKDAETHKKMVVKPKGQNDTTIEEIEAGFSVIDGGYAQFLTPNNSRQYVMKKFDQRELGYQNNDPDKTLLELMHRYQKLSDFYDEMIGVSLNPEEKYNQRIQTKYFMRADGNGAGSAYYLPGWIAMNSDHLTGFWSLEWGTLHEIAHGYQGWINNDPYIYLREISNNILSYAAQHNEEILPNQSSYWVDLKNNEKDMQGLRRRVMREVIPKTKEEYEDPSKVTLWQNFAQKYDLRYNLYTLLNLLDTFGDIKETFGKVNSQIREDSLKSPQASSELFNRQIFYAFSKYYQVDITPYMLSWGMTRLPETEEIYQMQKEGDHLVTLEDVIYDEETRKEVREKLNCRDLSPIKTSDLLSLNIPGKAKLKIEGSAFENIKGKAILIKNAGKVVRSVPVTSEEMEIELPVGVYTIEMPVPDDKGYQYSNKTQYLFSTNQEEKHSSIAQYYTTFEYKEKKKKVQSKDSMVVLGKNEEGKQGAAFQLGLNPRSDRPVNDLVVQINPEFKVVDKVQFDIYRQVMPDTEMFTGKVDRTYKAEKGGSFEEIKYNQKPSQVGNGDILAVTTTKENFENIRNYNEQGVEYLFNRPKETTTYYRMTNRGFKEVHLTDQEVEDALYEQEKISIIEELKEKIAQLKPEDFTSKFKQKQLKSDIYALYYSLKEKDQMEFAKVIEALKKGGKPEIIFKDEVLNEEQQIITEQGKESEIQWLDYIQVLDPEDGYIIPNEHNTTLSWKEEKKSQPKTYQLTYTVTDLDGNQSSKMITVVALPKKDFLEEEIKKVQTIIQKLPFLSEEQRLHWLNELETSYTKNDLQELLDKATKENQSAEKQLKAQTIEKINAWTEFSKEEKEKIKRAIEKVKNPKEMDQLLEKLQIEKEKRWQNEYQQAQEKINQYEFLSDKLKGEIQAAMEQAKTIEELQQMLQYATEKNAQNKLDYINDLFTAWEKEVDCSEKEKSEVKEQLAQCQTKIEMHALLKEKAEQWNKEFVTLRLEVITKIKSYDFLDTNLQQKLIQKVEVETNKEALKEIEKEAAVQNQKEKEKVQNTLYQLLDKYIALDEKVKEELHQKITQIKTKEEAQQLETEIHNLGKIAIEQWKNWKKLALEKIQMYSFLVEEEKNEAKKQIEQVATKEKLLEHLEYYYSLNETRKKEAQKELNDWVRNNFSKWDKKEVQQMLEKISTLNTKEEFIYYQQILQFYKSKKELESIKKYLLIDIDNNEFLTQEGKNKKKEEVKSLSSNEDCFSWWMKWLNEKETQLKHYRQQVKTILSHLTYLSPKQLSFYAQEITKAEDKKTMDTILHQAQVENERCQEEKLKIRKQTIIHELSEGQLPTNSIRLWKEKIQKATTISQLSKIQKEMQEKESYLWEKKREELLIEWKRYSLSSEQQKEVIKALEICNSYTELEQLAQKVFDYHKQNENPTFVKVSAYVQLKKDSILWNDLLCKDKKLLVTSHKIYKVKGYYQVGSKVLATLYDNNNQWQGYAELDNMKVLATPGGEPIQKEFYISINDNYPLWNDLNFNKKRSRAKKGNILKVKRYYQHFNGKTYLSVYNHKDQWQGYINVNAVNITLNKGKLPVKPYQKVARYKMIVRNNYTLWDDLTFKKKKGNTKKLLKEQVWVDKKYQHFNGSTYYSIYKDKNKKKWLGYVNSNVFKKS